MNKKVGRVIKKIVFSSMFLAAFFCFKNDSSAQNILRISGNDRSQTSLYVSDYNKSETAVLVNGYRFSDALSSINLVNKLGANVVLTDDLKDVNKIKEFVPELFNRNFKKVIIVGGTSSINQEIQNELEKMFIVERISGEDRYQTNKNVLNYSGYKKVCVADGRNYPDALSSSGLTKFTDSGLLLVDGSSDYDVPEGVEAIYTVGGVNSVKKQCGERISGDDRYLTSYKILSMINPKNAILVSGSDFPDALSASSLVSKLGASVVLSRPIFDEGLINLSGNFDNIYIVGGLKSVSGISVNSMIDKNKSKYIVNKKPKIETGYKKRYINTAGEIYKGWFLSFDGDKYIWNFYDEDGYMKMNTKNDNWIFDSYGGVFPSEDIKNKLYEQKIEINLQEKSPIFYEGQLK